MQQKIQRVIITFIRELINHNQHKAIDLGYYLTFYEKIFSEIHNLKLIRSLLQYRKQILSHSIDFIKHEPIFSVIDINSDLIMDINAVAYNRSRIWFFYKLLLDMSEKYCQEYVYLQLSKEQGYVVNYSGLDTMINKLNKV